MTEATKQIECIRVKGNSREKLQECITVESNLNLYVNDELVARFIYTAGYEEQLVRGFLLSSGMIADASQISRIDFENEDCNVRTSDTIHKIYANDNSLVFSHTQLLDVREALTSNQKNHYATRGFHGAIIWEIPTGRWFMCEDIGRHNAVDKVIGHGIQDDYALSNSMVLLSGRLISNIVSKCRISGIPLIASMTVATDEGIQLAVDSNMTIIGSLSGDGFWLYNEGVVKIT